MKDTCRTAENARHKRTGEKQTIKQTNTLEKPAIQMILFPSETSCKTERSLAGFTCLL